MPHVQSSRSRAKQAKVSQHGPRSLVSIPSMAANLRVLEISEIKTVPYVSLSHPFIERLAGTLRRELLDCTSLWTMTDLEAKRLDFQHYYNGYRTHCERLVSEAALFVQRGSLSC